MGLIFQVKWIQKYQSSLSSEGVCLFVCVSTYVWVRMCGVCMRQRESEKDSEKERELEIMCLLAVW